MTTERTRATEIEARFVKVRTWSTLYELGVWFADYGVNDIAWLLAERAALVTRVEALKVELSVKSDAVKIWEQHCADRDARIEALTRDAARLDWLQENAYQLSTVSEGETNDAIWDVFPNQMAVGPDGEEPSGKGVRAAIDTARAALSEGASRG